MGWLSGILSGYADRQHEITKEAADADLDNQKREALVYQTLLNSEDPEQQHMGATGILQMGQGRKRKGGFAGWMGEMQSSPIYPVVQKYMTTPQTKEVVTPGLSANRLPQQTPVAGQTQLPDVQPSGLVQSANSPTEGDAMAQPQPVPPSTPPAPPPTVAAAPPAPPPPLAPPNRRANMVPTMPASRAAPPPPPPAASAAPPSSSATGGPPPPPPAGPDEEVPDQGPMIYEPSPLVPLDRPPTSASGQPASALTEHVPGPEVGRTDVSTYMPRFANAEDQATTAARAKSLGDFRGDLAGYTEMFRAAGDPNPEKSAADAILQEHMRARGIGGQVRSISGQTLGPDGAMVQAFRVFDPTQQAYIDPVTRKPDPNFKPLSAIGMGPYYEQAATASGYSRGSMVPDWDFARVQALANELQQKAAYATGTGTGLAAAEKPITKEQRAEETFKYQGRWNQLNAPVRGMEQYLRVMSAAYQRYKAGDKTAWEPFRTAAVHVSEPNSVVMPSEFLRAGDIGSLVQRIEGFVSRTVEGGAPLPDAQIEEMMRTAIAVYQQMQTYNAGNRSAIEAAIKPLGIPPEQVFGAQMPIDAITAPVAAPTAPPRAATPGAPPAAAPAIPGATGTVWDPATGKFRVP